MIIILLSIILIVFFIKSNLKFMVLLCLTLEMMNFLLLLNFMMLESMNINNSLWMYLILIIILGGVLSLSLLVKSSKILGVSFTSLTIFF